MLMSTYKTNKTSSSAFMNVYDPEKRKFLITFLLLALLLLISIVSPAAGDYIELLQGGGKLKGIDNLYDYTVPLISSLLIFYVFFNDYQNDNYEILTFYSNRTFNLIVFKRWLMYIFPIVLGSFLAGMIYFRQVAFLNLDSLLLSLRFVPNILFLTALLLCVMVFTKSSYTGLFVTLIYYIVDFMTDSRMFKIFSIGANSNNFYYSFSPEYYYLNRFVILTLGLVFLFLACKRAAKL